MYQYVNSNSTKGKKIQHITNGLAIFLLISTLIAGSVNSSFNTYGQSNETNSPSEDVAEIISDTPPSSEDKDENTEQLISENTSTSESNVDKDDQNTPDEINPAEEEAPDSQPDGDCLFDPSLPKCAPDENGSCPEGFARNGDDQCYPRHDRCPEGYHSHEDDESGRCIPDNVPCDPGFIMNPDYPSCENKDRICQNHPDLETCKEDDVTNNLPYKSGYSHGCSDAKISDPDNRYINQPGKGANYHTNEFLRGYNDGFEKCTAGNNTPSNTKGTFKVIVEVTNQSPRDLSGGITVSVDYSPENIVKSAYGVYFPGDGETTSKIFTFKSTDVPVGTEFEVNIDYGDDYNQYKFGENSPEKRPEIVQFTIQ